MEKIHFYAPDRSTHYMFEYKPEELAKALAIKTSGFTAWIVSTYVRVKNAGLPCEFIDHIPSSGILFALSDSLGNRHPYTGELMVVCAKSDKEFHPSAYLHVVQNPDDCHNRKNHIWKPYYIPHWPQPNLISRRKSREFLVENVAYMGTRTNLAKELLSEDWNNSLRQLGVNWHPHFSHHKWSDYSEVDIIVAARSFSDRRDKNKPASKLINAWRAEVPAILAPESAFLAVRKSELDFAIVNSLDEIIDAIQKLKTNPKLYRSMLDNGIKRSQEFQEDKITQLWLNFFNEYVFPEYQRWLKMPELSRISQFLQRYTKLKSDRIRARLKRFTSKGST